MMSLHAAELIHNARNRLLVVAERMAVLGSAEDVKEIDRVAELLASAIAVLRPNPHKAAQSLDEVGLDIFFEELAAEAQRLSPAHLQTTCRADFSACLFNFWTFDRPLVHLAVIDALMNAWQHAENWVLLEVAWGDGALSFTVRDDGPGFPLAYLAAEAAISRSPASIGTGHGLQMAREIAEKHSAQGRRGRISLANEQGAVFRMILP
jgi:signal transduction histidine kinase